MLTWGSIVRFRKRDWVLLPSPQENVIALRPLTGAIDETVLVRQQLADLLGYSFPEERISPSSFPPPSPDEVSDALGTHLLWQAARLLLRDGAAPFRSLGRISIRPRVYQFVPLLMALRLDPVRLFIADDVGVGKTIEALLIARELIDRGEVSRLAVLCPPYLCDQWEKELREKFNLEAVTVQTSTIGRLDRLKPRHKSIYEYFPYLVISIDWVKTERNKYQFLQFCPEMVIVDEVHGAADTAGRNRAQQLRHQLLREIAADEKRHLILLTATPHSGVEEAFRSLLCLLRPEFQDWNLGSLTEEQRKLLAKHFVQRTRKDIESIWEADRCFPERISLERTYRLSPVYWDLFRETYHYCTEIVKTGPGLEDRRTRVRYWGALALLRCVMSSPAAAVAALEARRSAKDKSLTESEDSSLEDEAYQGFVYESADQTVEDETPVPPIEESEKYLLESERHRLKKLEKLARKLLNSPEDTKLQKCLEEVKNLLSEGFYPVIWCRYVATAEYVAKALEDVLLREVQVVCLTGRVPEEERRLKIENLDPDIPRVLVATDCLSEGINLQEKFNAVIHYDLPWNPNRLEQREGRVDRYGQRLSPQVKAVLLYGEDNPVDGAVIKVLLEKAREIYKTLGTHVPVPEESESVMQAVINALFLKGKGEDLRQKELFDYASLPPVKKFHQKWDLSRERERINRTRFAQRALKPEEVKRELEATDQVLGDPEAVKNFVLSAAKRLGLDLRPDSREKDVFLVNLAPEALSLLPEAIRAELPQGKERFWRISFVSPTPQGAEYVGRNHRLVTAMARFLFEEALTKGPEARAPRGGVIRTSLVNRLTALLLLRVRYLVEIPQKSPLLSEEVMVEGFILGRNEFLGSPKALDLLLKAKPEGNIPLPEKKELLSLVLEELDPWNSGEDQHPLQKALKTRILSRAKELEESHKRIRRAVSLRIKELKVRPQWPPDLLGLLILQPMVRG